jgi:diguanylate cyclase (GGDEF)-like protein
MMLVGVEIWQLWRVHQTNIEQADVVSSSTARAMSEQAENTLRTADTVVASLVEQVEAEGTGPEALTRFYRLMSSLAVALPAIHEMGIVDSQGNAIAKSLTRDTHGLNYAERTYFKYHATHTDRGPFIGARIKSKIDGHYSITVTRRINRPDGSFAGLAVTSVSLDFFQQMFDRLQARSGGIIALIGDDDAVLARSPVLDGIMDRPRGPSEIRRAMQDHPEAGSVSYVSALDGVRRRGSYQHLSQFPISTLIAQSEWDVQSSWRAELRSHGVIMACVMIVIVALGSRAVRATRMLAAQAMQDGLTGLANRRFFDETLGREVRRASRFEHPVSVILIDIDHFKQFNDNFGHPAGDDCLRSVARAIQGCLRRAGEFAARYGGEEIVVLLPNCERPRAVALAETMRLAVRGLGVRQATHLDDVVTFSAGVATRVPGHAQGEAQELVNLADTALYAAKAAGRNRVTAAGTPEAAAWLGPKRDQPAAAGAVRANPVLADPP